MRSRLCYLRISGQRRPRAITSALIAISVDRRLILWFVTSTAFLLIYMWLRAVFVPPMPEPNAIKQPPAAESLVDTSPLEAAPDAGTAAAAKTNANPPQPQKTIPPARITLGSMNPADDYYMLVTLNNRGGTVERIELTQRDEKGRLKYRRVDTTSGYLGYLATQNSPKSDGCIVNVVGPGTPAALATAKGLADPGLRPGDLIIAANAKAISGPRDLDEILSHTEPGQKITLEVERAVAPENRNEPDDAATDEPKETPETAAKASASTRLVFEAELTEHPLDLVRLASTGGDDEIDGNLSRLACRLTLSQLGSKSIPTGKSSIEGLEWISEAAYEHERMQAETQSVRFQLPVTGDQLNGIIAGPIKLERNYKLAPKSYLLDMDVAIRNEGTTNEKLAYRLEGPCGMTAEGWWYSTKISPNWFGGAAARDVIFNTEREGHTLVSGYDLLKLAKSKPVEPNQPIFGEGESDASRALRYIGVDAQYFDLAYLPPADNSSFTGLRQAAATLVANAQEVPTHKERAVDVSFFVDSIVADLPPNAAIKQPMRLFAGPKQPDLIDPLGLSSTVEYGMFGLVSKLLGGILHIFYRLFGNYAIAIILLTVLVRGLLFPVSRKAAIHAQRMQELAPELKKINEKYKDDMEGRLRAQRDFQKKVGFNPMAGCLPAFLQLPIFIGLYRCLSVDIELRQATFKSGWQWASNLAGPDQFYYWGDWLMDYFSGRGTGWLGPYFNILPVAVVILFLIQQKMFMPPATDEQQAFTQKVMTIMTLMMALFFFRVPAGLCVYFITSSTWGIIERIVVKKTIPQVQLATADGAIVDGVVTSSSSSSRSTATKTESAPSWADRLRQQIKPEEPKALPPSKRRKPGKK